MTRLTLIRSHAIAARLDRGPVRAHVVTRSGAVTLLVYVAVGVAAFLLGLKV